MFEKNYATLKKEIDHRNNNIEDKEKRIHLLEDQVVHDSKKIIAILPNNERKMSPSKNEQHLNP
jgi:hypothetical protein